MRYGLIVHLQLLSTPPRGDAVTFGYRVPEHSDRDFHPTDSMQLQAHQGTLRVWPLRWAPKLDELASLLAARNLSADEWDENFPNQTYRKTFNNLPIHYSLIESARRLAKNGQQAEATQRLEELLVNDPKLRLDPETEVKLSAAEALIENGRKLAMSGEKSKAISQFARHSDSFPGSSTIPKKMLTRVK